MAFQLGECLLLTLLHKKNMSQAEFARRMGVSRQYVNQLINGETTMSLIFAINAAHVLGCQITDLYKIVSNRKE
ncbi:putative transcriptional regulator [Brevibacillus sp. CF112]|uniref:helix-turn-helix domain-containing protein n=1 Tax=Brevibacillus TaxID=55080 RepID=UPI000271CC20|nr:helix-turn-helix transcriptional regulator [Brevibacillus sp. CF112]EJL45670.1 putative transcriptional regulator [Brevibacillus sp. CF112]